MRHKNVNWFGICTLNPKKKKKKKPKNLASKGSKMLIYYDQQH